jgi:hypothetical protein
MPESWFARITPRFTIAIGKPSRAAARAQRPKIAVLTPAPLNTNTPPRASCAVGSAMPTC